jgi:hypothetical protein
MVALTFCAQRKYNNNEQEHNYKVSLVTLLLSVEARLPKMMTIVLSLVFMINYI